MKAKPNKVFFTLSTGDDRILCLENDLDGIRAWVADGDSNYLCTIGMFETAVLASAALFWLAPMSTRPLDEIAALGDP